MSILPFYRIDFPIIIFPEYFTYVEYSQGKYLDKQIINNGDKNYASLKDLFLMEKNGWRYDLTTYVPNKEFKSPDMRINCTGNLIVVNYKDLDKEWTQISKKIAPRTCPSII